MLLKHLKLTGVGPFKHAELDFEPSPVMLITGENGTGKSIILDAIRASFGMGFCDLDRNIIRKDTQESKIEIKMQNLAATYDLLQEFNSHEGARPHYYIKTADKIGRHFCEEKTGRSPVVKGLFDYWPAAATDNDSFELSGLSRPDFRRLMEDPFSGEKRNADITATICHLDYMRDSRDPEERQKGAFLYGVIEKIVENSLLDGGRLSHVSRTTLDPIVIQNGTPVKLKELSGGNLFIIKNLVGLVARAYAILSYTNHPVEEMEHMQGLMLIDEAENQLHPRWQKKLFGLIRSLFPQLQIVAATHSPFIVASVEDAQLYVCKANGDHCVVEDQTGHYANKPIDEILMSPLFGETLPFNQKVTTLMEDRAKAARDRNLEKKKNIETELKALNPVYFSYLDLDQILESSEKDFDDECEISA